MFTIKFQFEDTKAIDATLLAALGEQPAKFSYQLIAQVHQQIAEQLAEQAKPAEPQPESPAAAEPASPVVN